MLALKQISLFDIQPWIKDFQKKSKHSEPIPNGSTIFGIYRNEELIGYFIIVCYSSMVVEINQGYLKPEARHKNISKISMQLLEETVKKAGYNRVMLGTNRAVGSYIRFMRSMKYNICRAIFEKKL